VSQQGIKCPDTMVNLMWANTGYFSGYVMHNSVGIVMLFMCKHHFCNVRWCIASHFLCSCVCGMDHEFAIKYHYTQHASVSYWSVCICSTVNVVCSLHSAVLSSRLVYVSQHWLVVGRIFSFLNTIRKIVVWCHWLRGLNFKWVIWKSVR